MSSRFEWIQLRVFFLSFVKSNIQIVNVVKENTQNECIRVICEYPHTKEFLEKMVATNLFSSFIIDSNWSVFIIMVLSTMMAKL